MSDSAKKSFVSRKPRLARNYGRKDCEFSQNSYNNNGYLFYRYCSVSTVSTGCFIIYKLY